MRLVDKNRAENFILKRQKYKKWLIFAVCLSIVTGTTTLYMMNKPAMALSLDGAESVGLVLETADEEYEKGLLEEAEGGSLEDEASDVTEGEAPGDAEQEPSDGSEEDALTDDPAADDEAKENSEELIKEGEGEGDPNAPEKELTEEEKAALEKDELSDEKLKDGKDKEEKPSVEIPESVEVSEYVTGTVIERKNSDGSWEVVDRSDIKDGDYIRITYHYDLPDEVKLSEDISLEIPDEHDFVEIEKATVLDGSGSAEVVGDTIKIEFNNDVKKDIKEELSLTGVLAGFFSVFVPLKVYAASEGVSVEGVAKLGESNAAGQTTPGFTITKTEVSINNVPCNSNNIKAELGDSIEFDIDFDLKIGTISRDNNVFYFDLGSYGIIPSYDVGGGNVIRKGATIGTFTITRDWNGTNGLIKFEIFPEVAQLNSKDDLDGEFYFRATVGEAIAPGEDEVIYRLGDSVTVTVTIVSGEQGDLSVAKSVDESRGGYNKTNGTIAYSVRVSSNNGSNGAITLSDIMTAYGSNNYSSQINASRITGLSVTKYNSSGAATPQGANLTANGNEFNMALGELQAGEYYIINYNYPLPDSLKNPETSVTVDNKATAAVGDKTYPASNVQTLIGGSKPEINKYGTVDLENRVATWTIDLNNNRANLRGYTLRDMVRKPRSDWGYTLSPGNFTMTFTRDDGSSFTRVVNGDYTFNTDDTNHYRITYQQEFTPLDLVYGNLQNEASIRTNPDNASTGNISYGSIWVSQSLGLVNKQVGSLTPGSDGYVNIPWTITLQGPINRNEGRNNGEYWTFHDEIRDSNEVITNSQLNSILSAFRQKFGANNVALADAVQSSAGNVSGYKSFTIRVSTDFTGSDLTINYTTSGFIDDGLRVKEFSNQAYVFSSSSASTATTRYEPLISKYDGEGNKSDSAYEYYSDNLFQKGILSWRLNVSVPTGSSQRLVITDSMPQYVEPFESLSSGGTTIVGLEVADNSGFSNAVAFSGGSATCQGVRFTRSASGGNTVISFNTSGAEGKTFYFRIRGKISDSYNWAANGYRGYFKNEATIANENGTSLGHDSQGQTITRTEKPITKTGVALNNNEKINTIRYTLDINPNASSLLTGKDSYTLRDTLETIYTMNAGDSRVIVHLVEGSLKVCEVVTDSNGNEVEQELDPAQYQLKTAETNPELVNENSHEYSVLNSIELILPDEKHLKVYYEYFFSGQKHVSIRTTNSAYLEGVGGENSSNPGAYYVYLEEVKSTINAKGIDLYKVDADNYNIYLYGATFALYKYDGARFVDTGTTYRTGLDYKTGTETDGHAMISKLDYDTAYYVKELEAPEGYKKSNKPLYFCIKSDTSSGTMLVPDNFEALGGKYVLGGSSLKFPNEKQGTSITLKKKWDYGANADTSVQPDSVDIVLGRRYGSLIPDEDNRYHSVKIARRNNNVYTERGVQLLPSVLDGSTVNYSFVVHATQWYSVLPTVKVNGVEQDYSGQLTYEGVQTVTLSTLINSDTSILINYNDGYLNGMSKGKTEVKEPNKDYNSGNLTGMNDDSFNETVTLVGPDWTTKLDHIVNENGETVELPRYVDIENEDGTFTKYQWLYYAKEINSAYYDDIYSDVQGGISSGTITITNVRNGREGYALPVTGGIGDKPFVAAGLGFMCLALIYAGFIRYMRKKKELLTRFKGEEK